MKLHLSKKRLGVFHTVSVLAVCFLLLLSGCGNNKELEAYRTNMDQFFENIQIYDSSINAIDPESETAVQDLLSLLDSMDRSFAQMASLKVPDGFPGVAELAAESSNYMTQAVSCYHQAFEGETYDSVMADVAKQYYDRSNLMLQYIISIYQGDIPEEIFTYDDTDIENSENEEDTLN